MATALYICYFGLDQPLVQTQVVPYLAELAKAGHAVELLTFEPDVKRAWTPERVVAAREELSGQGITWHHLAYHKRPSALATAWDISVGVRWIRRRMRQKQIDILHGRAHVATLMGALARKLSSQKPKLLFDIRGFMPEEYTDAGVWPENGAIYRAAKKAEKWLLEVSDGFVVLTEAARRIMFAAESRPVEVIPCCVDFEDRFPSNIDDLRATMRERLGVSERRVFTHIGALGGLYLTQELADFVAAARQVDQSTYALFLTQTDPAEITEALIRREFSEDDFFVGRVPPSEIPGYLAASDAGLSFVKATYSTQSRSPTKIPEYLAAGLPVIANAGVGDVDELVKTREVGILIDRFDRQTYLDAISRLAALGNMQERCQRAAREEFDLKTVGGVRYRRLYEKLLQTP